MKIILYMNVEARRNIHETFFNPFEMLKHRTFVVNMVGIVFPYKKTTSRSFLACSNNDTFRKGSFNNIFNQNNESSQIYSEYKNK